MKRPFVPLMFVVLAWARVSSAQAPSTPSAADRESARSLMDDGDRAFAEKRFADAVRAYSEADTIMHVPTTSAELAKALSAAGRLIDAKEACRRTLAYPKQPSEPKPFADARQSCTTITATIGDRIPSVTLRILGGDPNVTPQLTIDGEAVVVTSREIKRKVDPGMHRVVVKAPGHEDLTTSFTIAERANDKVDLALRPARPGAPAPATASVPPVTNHGGDAPTILTTTSPPPPDASDPGVPLYAKIAFGAGAAGLVAGTITGLMAISRVEAAKKSCDGNVCDPVAKPDAQAAATLSHVSTIGFAVGLVGAGVGVYGVLTRNPKPSKVEAYFTGTGAFVSGRF
ncbi:MAG: hypothetical protein U0169_04615 [Polyangiaceae bacterium]